MKKKSFIIVRRWVQAAFRLDDKIPKISKEAKEEFDVDISEGFAFEMFGISSPKDEVRV